MDYIKPPKGAVRERKKVGRGMGSGHGKTSTKGHKGQKARSGGGVRIGFEGGQTPLLRRIPKRGFNNKKFGIQFNEINVDLLNKFNNGDVIKIEEFKSINKLKFPKIKILGNGKLEKKLEIHADKFSKSAVEKIEKAGGKAVIIEKSSKTARKT